MGGAGGDGGGTKNILVITDHCTLTMRSVLSMSSCSYSSSLRARAPSTMVCATSASYAPNSNDNKKLGPIWRTLSHIRSGVTTKLAPALARQTSCTSSVTNEASARRCSAAALSLPPTSAVVSACSIRCCSSAMPSSVVGLAIAATGFEAP